MRNMREKAGGQRTRYEDENSMQKETIEIRRDD